MDKSPKNIGIVVGAFLMGLLVASLFLIITAPGFLPHPWEGRPPSFAAVAQKSLAFVVSISVQASEPEFSTTSRKPSSGREGGRDGFPDSITARLDAEQQRLKIIGSGLIISPDGNILTNCHVLDQAQQPLITLSSGKQFSGQLVGRDPQTDLALIKITTEVPLPSAVLGNSDTVQVGDWVIAIGNPLGFEHSCNIGVISAKGRTLGMGLYDDFLQTDAFMHKGSSGGALVDASGRVIGINTALLSEGKGEGRGVNFAIPINLAKNIAAELLAKGRVVRGWLGVVVGDIVKSAASPLAPKGVLVMEVFAGGPAAAAGIRTGDIIVGADNKTFNNSRELLLFIASLGVDKTLKIAITREGQPLVLDVLIRERASHDSLPVQQKTQPASLQKHQMGGSKRKNPKGATAYSPGLSSRALVAASLSNNL